MKKLLIVFLSVFVLHSCNKEDHLTEEITLPTTSLEKVQGYKVTNGMLDFASLHDFYTLKEQLKNDARTPSKVDLAYQVLGYKESDFDKEMHIPSQPTLNIFEQELGFESARAKEETAYHAFLSTGADPIDFEEHFIDDEYLKTLLNVNNEVKIGSRIFKYYNEDIVVMIGNSDFNSLRKISSIGVSDLKDMYNIRVLDMRKDSESDLVEGDKATGKKRLKSLTDLKVSYEIVDDNRVKIHNLSYVDDEDGTFKWTFDNGYSYTGKDVPMITWKEGENALNVKLTYTPRGGGEGDYTSTDTDIFRWCVDTEFDLDASNINGQTITINVFEDAGWTRFPCAQIWDFGDGTVITTSSTTVSHTYSEPGTYTITIESTCPPNPYYDCVFFTEVVLECEGERASRRRFAEQTINGRRHRINAKIWCGGQLFGARVGARTKTQWRRFGGWFGRRVDQVWCSIEGNYLELDGGCRNVNLPYLEETEMNSGYISRDVGAADNPRVEEDGLHSTHRAREGGVTWELPGGLTIQ